MSKLNLFLKQNQKVKENTKYKATKSFTNENGEPLEWEIRAITTKENERIREECISIDRKKKGVEPRMDIQKYIAKLICAAVVFPDLNNAELQDSYGVKKPEDLIKEMIPLSGEYNNLAEFVQSYSGFDIELPDQVEEAKN